MVPGSKPAILTFVDCILNNGEMTSSPNLFPGLLGDNTYVYILILAGL